ncbi:MAG TPA: beta-hydroxyacyl-ACP dehydratase [Desulfobacterales bacterium]|nr:beta-hydroxyacyl-ACP dehydratase [Desulfobacterales bacterium]
MRFYLYDRVEEICYGRYMVAVKCITLADDVFDEHFPGHPIFPGSLIMEGLAQLGGALFELTMRERGEDIKFAMLSMVNRLKFRKPAKPGDRLVYRVEIKVMRDDYGVVKAKACLDSSEIATGELLFAFMKVDAGQQNGIFETVEITMKKAKVVTNEGSV